MGAPSDASYLRRQRLVPAPSPDRGAGEEDVPRLRRLVSARDLGVQAPGPLAALVLPLQDLIGGARRLRLLIHMARRPLTASGECDEVTCARILCAYCSCNQLIICAAQVSLQHRRLSPCVSTCEATALQDVGWSIGISIVILDREGASWEKK